MGEFCSENGERAVLCAPTADSNIPNVLGRRARDRDALWRVALRDGEGYCCEDWLPGDDHYVELRPRVHFFTERVDGIWYRDERVVSWFDMAFV
jgi:hypothetical protein